MSGELALPYGESFVAEVNQVAVVLGLDLNEAARVAFRAGVAFISSQPAHLHSIVVEYMPDDVFHQYIKGSKCERNRLHGNPGQLSYGARPWKRLSDAYFDMPQQADHAFGVIASILPLQFSRDRSYLRRIVMALGVAKLLNDNGVTPATPVGTYLSTIPVAA